MAANANNPSFYILFGTFDKDYYNNIRPKSTNQIVIPVESSLQNIKASPNKIKQLDIPHTLT